MTPKGVHWGHQGGNIPGLRGTGATADLKLGNVEAFRSGLRTLPAWAMNFLEDAQQAAQQAVGAAQEIVTAEKVATE